MELHLVHYKSEYGSDLSSAIAGGESAFDTLAVLGIMFEEGEEENHRMAPIVDGEIKCGELGGWTWVRSR